MSLLSLILKSSIKLAMSTALLAACVAEERLEADRLVGQRTLIVAAEVSNRTVVRSAAYTKSEGATTGASAASTAAVDAWMTSGELGLWVLALAPIAIPITVAVSGAAGAASGAASGTPMNRENIELAIENVQANFRPSEVEALLEDKLVQTIRHTHPDTANVCVDAQRKKVCPLNRSRALVLFEAAIQLAPSRRRAGKGDIDVLTHLTISAQPQDLMQPVCVTWVHRRAAGNLFDLANGGKTAVMGQVRASVAEIATQAPAILFSEAHRPDGEAWDQVDCRLWERALARG